MLITSTSSERESLDLLGVQVSLIRDPVHVYKLENKALSSWVYSITFGGNRILRSLMINEIALPGSAEATMHSLGLVFSGADSEVEHVLGPHFEGLGARIVSRPSRRPAIVGAVVSRAGGSILFSFGLFRGALRSPLLGAEILDSVRILPTTATPRDRPAPN